MMNYQVKNYQVFNIPHLVSQISSSVHTLKRYSLWILIKETLFGQAPEDLINF